jgi:Skp family chaperone for outer membrane proteins
MKSNFKRRYLLVLLAMVGLGISRPAIADGGTKIAVANPSKILALMDETKDLKKAEEGEIQRLDAEKQTKGKELQDMKSKRDNFTRKGTPDYDKQTGELIQKSADLRVWADVQQARLTEKNKQQMKTLFDKIQSAIAEVSQQKNIDLVLTDFGGDIPQDLEDIAPDRLRQIISQKSVLYAAKGVDITDDVIARLNANYKAGAGAPSK